MRVRGLKHCVFDFTEDTPLSHPMRVRGLKQGAANRSAQRQQSHPMRVRGLKLEIVIYTGY